MTRPIDLFIRFTVAAVLCMSGSSRSETLNQAPIDYKKFTPSSISLADRKRLIQMCERGRVSADSAELGECAFIAFKRSERRMTRSYLSLIAAIRKGDVDLKEDGYPLAQPHFYRSQKNWLIYRNEHCNGAAYEMGRATMAQIYFWECMTKITDERTDQIIRYHKYISD